MGPPPPEVLRFAVRRSEAAPDRTPTASRRATSVVSASLLASMSVAVPMATAAPSPALPALADPSATNDDVASVTTIVIAGGDAATGAALTTSLQRSVERLGTTPRFRQVATMSPREVAMASDSAATRSGSGSGSSSPSAGDLTTVGVWIDLTASRGATVYVTEGNNIFTRTLALDRGLDAVSLDLLEVIVTSALETILSGRPLGVSREEFTRSLERPPERATAPSFSTQEGEKPPPPAWRMAVGGFYEGLLAARGQPVHGPGVVLGAQGPWIAFGLSLHAHVPFEVTAAGTTVRLTMESVRLWVGRSFAVGSGGLSVFIGLNAGADITRARTTSAGSDVTPAGAFFAADPVLRPLAGIEHAFGTFSLGGTFGVDVDLRRPSYVVRTETGSALVWKPSALRPVAGLVARFTF